MNYFSLILTSPTKPETLTEWQIIMPLGKIEPISPLTLSREIRSLPRFLQLLLLLLCYDGLSTPEAAEFLELSPASVKTGLAHALDLLRRKTERWLDCDDVQNALVYAIEHETFPAEQLRRVRTKLERSLFDSPCISEEETI